MGKIASSAVHPLDEQLFGAFHFQFLWWVHTQEEAGQGSWGASSEWVPAGEGELEKCWKMNQYEPPNHQFVPICSHVDRFPIESESFQAVKENISIYINDKCSVYFFGTQPKLAGAKIALNCPPVFCGILHFTSDLLLTYEEKYKAAAPQSRGRVMRIY